MKLTFLGATGTVTGSKSLIEEDGFKCLVDCGLFQGHKELRLRNWLELPVRAKEINAVILTHAHIDHSGYLPLLVKRGFKGPIYSTSATRDLCSILLPDAGKLQEEEAAFANRKGFSKHSPAEPLFTMEDGERAMEHFKTVPFGKEIELKKGLTVKFNSAGHILGAASVTLTSPLTSIAFSGDLGRANDLLMAPPQDMSNVDYLVVESTYGDRLHQQTNPVEDLGKVINRTIERGGSVIIPAFSVGRTQALLYAIHLLRESKSIPSVPVYLNSPMSISAMGVYGDHRHEHRLGPQQCKDIGKVARYVRTAEESKLLNTLKTPMIIVSASGMATGGRVIHHLKAFAPDPKNTILLIGYQAGGTRGDSLKKGAKTVKIHGQFVPVNAEVTSIDGFSAHADQDEILQWLKKLTLAPKMTFITHGELTSAEGLQKRIESELKWKTCIPEYLNEFELK